MPLNEVEEPPGYWDQMEMTLTELAILFAAKGWIYKDGNIPTPDDFKEVIAYVVSVIEASNEPGSWSNLGRLMVTQDPEYDSYYSVSLELGLIPKTFITPDGEVREWNG